MTVSRRQGSTMHGCTIARMIAIAFDMCVATCMDARHLIARMSVCVQMRMARRKHMHESIRRTPSRADAYRDT